MKLNDILNTAYYDITREAFRKANLYAMLVSEIVQDDIEIGGHTLNFNNKNDLVVRDVYLDEEQRIKLYRVDFSGAASYSHALKHSYDSNQRIIGIWHSHGGFPAFHSKADEGHIENTYFKSRKYPFILKSEKKLVSMSRANLGNANLYFPLSEKEGFEVVVKDGNAQLFKVKNESIKNANSLVINRECYNHNILKKHSSYYAEAIVQKGPNDDSMLKKPNLELRLIDEANDINLDIALLVREIGSKVIYNDKRLSEHPNYKTVLDKYAPSNHSTFIQPNDELKALDKSRPFEPLCSGQAANGYRRNIREFYTTTQNEKLAMLAKALSGDYVENGKRYWFWKDRLAKANELYKNLGFCPEIHQMRRIIEKNRYAKRRYARDLLFIYGNKSRESRIMALFKNGIKKGRNKDSK